MFTLLFTSEALKNLNRFKEDPGQNQRYKAVKKTIEFLAANPRHPGLQTHEYLSLLGPDKEKVFEAYAQQATPAAYRVFWYYGPGKGVITIVAITPHP